MSYERKRTVPITLPCGTPEIRGIQEEEALSIGKIVFEQNPQRPVNAR